MKGPIVIILLVSLCLTSCITSKMIANNVDPVLVDMQTAFFREKSPTHAETAGPALLMMMDGFLISSPDNETLLIKGATLNCGYALTFLDYKDTQWAGDLYDKGRDYAFRALALDHPDLIKALSSSDTAGVSKALAGMEKEDLPGIFWAGLCWGGKINSTKSSEDVADLALVEQLLEKAMALDETYFFSAAHLFYGMKFASLSRTLGGNPEAGKVHFDKAIELTGGTFLLAKVMYAVTYAVNVQDGEKFVSLLTEVEEADLAELPIDSRLPNAVAKKRARELLEKTAQLIPSYKPVDEEDAYDSESLDAEDLNF